MCGTWGWIGSWILTVLTVALIAAVVDEATYRKLENNQKFGFFLVFVLPTLMEAFSYYAVRQPIFYGVF